MNTKIKTVVPTILVVDDMPICREPIADILSARGFDVILGASGEEALAKLESQRVDLLLLDVMMPGMDGLSVLTILRRDPRWTSLPVVLLTDAAQADTVRNAARIGVQGYLLKSNFSVDNLVSLVEKQLGAASRTAPNLALDGQDERPRQQQAAPSKDTTPSNHDRPGTPPEHQGGAANKAKSPSPLDKDQVLKKIRRQLQLRPVPPVLQYLIAQTNSRESSFDDVVKTVRQDQALALRVMKVANSSFYATGKRAQNLVEAAQRIGMTGIRNAVTAILAIDHFSDASSAELVPQRFWEHSLASAVLAQSLGEAVGAEDADELFLAGLLHDLGRLILSSAFPDHYKHILASSEERAIDPSVVEGELFGMTHADVTDLALGHLQMANVIVAAASAHERPISEIKHMGRASSNAAIVALANRLAHALALGDSGSAMLLSTDGYAEILGLKPQRIGAIAREVAAKTRDVEIFYASQSDEPFREALAAELGKKVERPIKLTVIAPHAPHDSLSLLCEQLGWLDTEKPQLAILWATSATALTARFDELEKQEHTVGEKLPVLIASPPENSLSCPPQVSQERPCEAVHLPTRYTPLVETIVKLHDAATALSR